MSSLGLKTNIAINTAIILFFGMLLTAFMVISFTQRIMVNSITEKGEVVISVAREMILSADHDLGTPFPLDLKIKLQTLVKNSGALNLFVVCPGSGIRYEYGKSSDLRAVMEQKAREACREKKTSASLKTDGWGIFWKHHQNIVLSGPVEGDDGIVAGMSVLVPLSPLFEKIRRVAKIIIIYILINAFILTFAAVHQISKMTVRPINRLLSRAGTYRADMSPALFEEKSGNEFRRLSSALNNMLERISGDREKLKETVYSLEQANTELKKAHKEILRAEKLASVGRLSAGIAHEIGNPLGIVSGYLELIKDDSLGRDEKTDFIERAENEIRRIDRIIRQLLDFSRKSKENASETGIAYIIREVREMVRVQPFMNNIRLDSDRIGEGLFIKADPDKLKQVFLNLIINAVDAINSMDEKREGIICISAEKSEKRALLLIEDNGPGIPEAELDNIFDPFYTTKEPGKGTGLGLSVCFMIIEDLDGKITIESTEGTGTRFRISLPLAEKLHTEN